MRDSKGELEQTGQYECVQARAGGELGEVGVGDVDGRGSGAALVSSCEAVSSIDKVNSDNFRRNEAL